MAEGPEGLGVAEEAVEGLVVQLLDELRPDLADARHVPLAHGAVHVGEVGALFEALVPGGGDVQVDLRQVVDGLGVVGLALEVDDRRRGGLGKGVGPGPGPPGRCSAAAPWRTAGSASRPSRRSATGRSPRTRPSSRPPIRSASYTTGLRPIFISSYAATIPDRPPPMTATSVPCSVAGIWPRPAGWARKSSYAYGKSGPNMVIGGCCSSACSTALGTVDVMGYGLLAKRTRGKLRGNAGEAQGWWTGDPFDQGPVEAGAAVLQIRVRLTGGGRERRGRRRRTPVPHHVRRGRGRRRQGRPAWTARRTRTRPRRRPG
ncbi:hypothetical protein SGLAM104S_00760 [Streptomyces glaucescens]